MQKNKLLSFIDRYYLAGNCDAVLIKETNDGVECEFIDQDQTVIGNVTMIDKEINLVGDLAINHTGTLIKMLTALENEIDVKTITSKVDSSINSEIQVIDSNRTKVKFMLANKAVIPAVPNMKQLPSFEVEIPMSDAFCTRFVKAKNALPEAKNFAVEVKNGNTILTVNYSTSDTDNIQFESVGTATTDIDATLFSADKLKEIIVANKGNAGKMQIASAGLAKVSFVSDEFESNYYLVKLQN